MANPLLSFTGVMKRFPLERGILRRKVGEVHAVNGIDLQIHPGETLALVGESGCGKSTTARMAMAADPPTAGQITLDTVDGPLAVHTLRGTSRLRLWRDVQLVFQDPYTSLNARMTVRQILAEPLRNFGLATGRAADDRIEALLRQVGLTSAAMNRYPHAFSGGQRQRIGIARALAVGPRLLIADEPVSALDVSVAAQILNLFSDLRETMGLTYLLITHDLSVVRHISHRTAVMYAGRIVEEAPTEQLFAEPRHPYTRTLIAAAPSLHTQPGPARRLPARDAAPVDRPQTGCPFHHRCPIATDHCREVLPLPVAHTDQHMVLCHYPHGRSA